MQTRTKEQERQQIEEALDIYLAKGNNIKPIPLFHAVLPVSNWKLEGENYHV